MAVGAGCGLAGVLISTRYDVAAGGTVTGTPFAVSLAATAARNAVARHVGSRVARVARSSPGGERRVRET
ncbi:hypothetical protein GCM10023191_038620 [Actinoallomurus oryzae]|uniref:Uncharacterized protein n=1 Tax=Actinoallomurus oryzae TaxID=502180 RepID=A0ABP8Q4H4_9ACTN